MEENGNYYSIWGLSGIGGGQSYDPFLGTLHIRCRIIKGIQKGTIILTTTHIGHIGVWGLGLGMLGVKGYGCWGFRVPGLGFRVRVRDVRGLGFKVWGLGMFRGLGFKAWR